MERLRGKIGRTVPWLRLVGIASLAVAGLNLATLVFNAWLLPRYGGTLETGLPSWNFTYVLRGVLGMTVSILWGVLCLLAARKARGYAQRSETGELIGYHQRINNVALLWRILGILALVLLSLVALLLIFLLIT
jgi:hypothetical protein